MPSIDLRKCSVLNGRNWGGGWEGEGEIKRDGQKE